MVKAWKQENDMASLSWSVQSLDLNLIKHLWDELKRKVQMHLPLPKNRNELWVILQEEWLNIEVDKYQKLVDSMPCWVAAVLDSKVIQPNINKNMRILVFK